MHGHRALRCTSVPAGSRTCTDAGGGLRARATDPRMCSCFVTHAWLPLIVPMRPAGCPRRMGTDCRPGRDPLNSQVVVVVQNTDRVNNPRSHLFLQRFSSSKSRHEFKNAISFLTWLFFLVKNHVIYVSRMRMHGSLQSGMNSCRLENSLNCTVPFPFYIFFVAKKRGMY